MDVRSEHNAAPFEPPLEAPARWGLVGVALDKRRQPTESIFAAPGFTLGVVEFDDQGRCHRREQMHAVAAHLKSLAGKDPIIVTFVHGWKHNADSDDANLTEFCKLLGELASHPLVGGRGRPVFGIFAGWRGQSFYAGLLTNATFWNRKPAALRVAMGAPRELFERLHRFRKQEVALNRNPALVIAGHSFGGLIVYSALAQSLISAALTEGHQVVPSFANLVLLVNPAFEAIRYLPVFDLVRERTRDELGTVQPPVFISVTAKNDTATGYAFPWGMFLGQPLQFARRTIEAETMLKTMGHVPFLQTHDISAPSGSVVLTPRPVWDKRNPFWVVSAAKEVIDNHNGIWKPVFLGWVKERIIEQLANPQTPEFR